MNKPTKMRKVELAVLNADHTWWEVIAKVPASLGADREAIVSWVEKNMMGSSAWGNVACVQLYSIPD
jgi:hypothetical protein